LRFGLAAGLDALAAALSRRIGPLRVPETAPLEHARHALLASLRHWYHVRLTRLAARVGEQLGRAEPEAPTHSARPRELAALGGLVDPGFGPAQKGRSVADGQEPLGGRRDRLAG